MEGTRGVDMVTFCSSVVRVRAEDVMSVEEAIRSCDREALLSCTLWGWAGWCAEVDLMPGAARAALARKFDALLDLMLAVGTEAPARQQVIMPLQSYRVADVRGLFSRRVGAVLVDCAKLALAEDAVRSAGGRVCSLADMRAVEELLDGERLSCMVSRTGAIQDISCLRDAPWPSVLGMRIWLPHDLAPSERAMALGQVVWLMVCDGLVMQSWDPGEMRCCSGAACDPLSCEKLSDLVDLLNHDACVDAVEAFRDIVSML